MPQINTHQTFKFTGSIGTSLPVNVPLTPNPIIVVILQSTSPSANTPPSPATSITDTMSNQYQRIKSSSGLKQSAGQYITAFSEIWVAQSPFPIPAAASVTVQYPTNSVVVADLIVLTSITPNYYIGIDSAATSNGGGPNLITPIATTRIVNAGAYYNTTSPNELIIAALTYLIELGSPTNPNVVASGTTTLLDVIDNAFSAIGDGAVQSGLAILTANAANVGSTLLSANLTLVGGQSLVTFFELIAFSEGPYPPTSVPQFIIPSATPITPASKAAQVATLTAPINVLQLPLSQ
jgi:hypothetical protein